MGLKLSEDSLLNPKEEFMKKMGELLPGPWSHRDWMSKPNHIVKKKCISYYLILNSRHIWIICIGPFCSQDIKPLLLKAILFPRIEKKRVVGLVFFNKSG